MKTIWITGIPGSGKSTLAERLHLYLEHEGKLTIYLDDEAIKRADPQKIMNCANALVKDTYDKNMYTLIVASTKLPFPFNSFGGFCVYCECPYELAAMRDFKRYPGGTLEERKKSFRQNWGTHDLHSDIADLKINTAHESEDKCFEELKKYI